MGDLRICNYIYNSNRHRDKIKGAERCICIAAEGAEIVKLVTCKTFLIINK